MSVQDEWQAQRNNAIVTVRPKYNGILIPNDSRKMQKLRDDLLEVGVVGLDSIEEDYRGKLGSGYEWNNDGLRIRDIGSRENKKAREKLIESLGPSLKEVLEGTQYTGDNYKQIGNYEVRVWEESSREAITKCLEIYDSPYQFKDDKITENVNKLQKEAELTLSIATEGEEGLLLEFRDHIPYRITERPNCRYEITYNNKLQPTTIRTFIVWNAYNEIDPELQPEQYNALQSVLELYSGKKVELDTIEEVVRKAFQKDKKFSSGDIVGVPYKVKSFNYSNMYQGIVFEVNLI